MASASERLPNEILLQIFPARSEICPKDLLNISCSCAHFYEIVQPNLYSEFHQMRPQAVPHLLRTLISKPHLGNYFKHFGLSFSPNMYSHDVNMSFLSKDNRTWIQQKLRKSSYDENYCNQWYKDIMRGYDNWDPIAGFVLLLCSTNIESIKLYEAFGDTSYTFYVRDVLRLPERQQRAEIEGFDVFFPKLRRASFSTTVNREKIDAKLLWTCLNNRKISQLHIEGLCGGSLKDFTQMVQEMEDNPGTRRFATTDLSIQHCGLLDRILPKFVSHFASLERFKYHNSCSWMRQPNRCSCQTIGQLMKGLSHSRDSLKEFVLSHDRRICNMHVQALEPLSHFENLRVLHIDHELLFALDISSPMRPKDQFLKLVNSLPKSLEVLTLRRCTTQVFSVLLVLLNSRRPNLKTVQVSTSTLFAKCLLNMSL